jgi:hypothetical protein
MRGTTLRFNLQDEMYGNIWKELALYLPCYRQGKKVFVNVDVIFCGYVRGIMEIFLNGL